MSENLLELKFEVKDMDITEKVSIIEKKILDETKAKKEKILQKERKKWGQKYEEFQQNLKAEEEKILNSYRQEARRQRKKITSKVNLKRKKLKRRKRHEFLQQLLAGLLERLKQYRGGDDYSSFLKKMIERATQILPPGEVYIKLNKADFDIYHSIKEKLVTELSSYELNLKEEGADIAGGVIVENYDGSEIVENSFQTYLGQIKGDIAREIQMKV